MWQGKGACLLEDGERTNEVRAARVFKDLYFDICLRGLLIPGFLPLGISCPTPGYLQVC